MKKVSLLSIVTLSSFSVWSGELSVKITSLTNIKGNGAMEACGVVKDQKKQQA